MSKTMQRSKKYVNKLKMELNGCYRTKANSKVFPIPYSE